MSRTFKDQDLSKYAPNAREAHERARRDRAFAMLVGFYLPEQEVLSEDDLTAQAVKRVMEGR
jgi:hypothetical protein